MASQWQVVAEPQGKNPGVLDKAKSAIGADDPKNIGGMVIYVTNGTSKQEVSRVAWIRRNSKNPKTSFEKQFQTELEKARSAVTMLNDTLVGTGELQ